MTDREKVIRGLECIGGYLHMETNPCTDCGYNECQTYAICIGEVARDTLELLKEQEAMKPIYNEQKYGDHLPHCGNCEKTLPNNAVYGKVNFCHYCGKAVKWE